MKQVLLVAFTALLLAACNDASTNRTTTSNDSANTSSNATNSEEAKEERNKQTILASMKSMEKGDVDAAFKDVDRDIVDYGEGSMAPVKDVDSIKAGIKMWLAAVPDHKETDITIVADGDYVMVYSTSTGTWKNDFMGMKATGKPYTVRDVTIFKFNDAGKVIEHRTVQSNAELVRQIGMKMPTQ